MRMHNTITSIAKLAVASCLFASLVIPAFASTPDSNVIDPNECTGSGVSTLIEKDEYSPRVTISIGECGGKWSSIFGWAYGYSGVYSWGDATYLYVEATVTAKNKVSQTKTASSTNSNATVETDKIYQSEDEDRMLSCYHIVRGYNASDDYRDEEYEGEWDF